MGISLIDLQEIVTDREARHAGNHGVTKNWTQLSNWKATTFFIKLCLKNWTCISKHLKMVTDLTLYRIFNWKWIMDLNTKCKTIRLVEENIVENPIGLVMSFRYNTKSMIHECPSPGPLFRHWVRPFPQPCPSSEAVISESFFMCPWIMCLRSAGC